MHALSDDYDLVLEGSEESSLEVARQYLEEAGIPTLLDHALSSAAYLGLAPPARYARLFVPKGMRARADEVLANLRGQSGELERLVESGVVPGPAVVERVRRGPVERLALVILIVIVAGAMVAWLMLR